MPLDIGFLSASDLVAFGRQLSPVSARNVLHLNVASAERMLAEPRRL